MTSGKEILLLLHGALGSSDQFEPLLPFLEDHFQLHRIDFEGHGQSSLRSRPFRIEYFAEDVIEYLDQHSIDSINIFGYSMGGYVACYLASLQPDRVKRIATLGTKFVWNTEVARRETALLDPDKILAKVPKFAQALSDRHTATDWKTVLNQTRDLLWSLADHNLLDGENLARITQPALIIVGDQDNTVTIEEAEGVAKSLAHGQALLLANTVHPFEKVPHAQLAQLLIEFFA
jgi:pimeloyl-ACP methyl ester carboxylesterase